MQIVCNGLSSNCSMAMKPARPPEGEAGARAIVRSYSLRLLTQAAAIKQQAIAAAHHQKKWTKHVLGFFFAIRVLGEGDEFFLVVLLLSLAGRGRHGCVVVQVGGCMCGCVSAR